MVGRLGRVAAGVLLLPATVLAFAPSSTPCAAFWSSSAVFAGRVESVVRAGQERRVTFTVLESFRGTGVQLQGGGKHASRSTLTVGVASGAPCASRLRQGRELIVYVRRAANAGELMAVDCARTRELDDAAADLSYARSVVEGSAPTGTVNGQVLLIPRDLSGRVAGTAVPVPDIPVRITTSTLEERAVTNIAGEFSVAARGAGSYLVSLELPARYSAEASTARIDLTDPRACGDVELRLGYDGRLSGRVLDASSRPLPGLTVDASTVNLVHRRRVVTDREGRYEFTRLPPGAFVIGVASGASRAGRAPQAFLPGVAQASGASRVTVGPGERVAAPDFRLPAAVRYVAITGFVLDADGRPAEGAQVYVKGPAEDDRIVGEPVTADFMGRFEVAILAGSDHALFAERHRGSRVDSSEPLRITPGDGMKPLRLVLQRRY